jgi:hypothetical protein
MTLCQATARLTQGLSAVEARETYLTLDTESPMSAWT